MDPQAIEDKVKSIIVSQLGVDAGSVIGKANFIDDLGADSLDIVELVMELETNFGVEIPEEETENIRTVEDAVNYIKKSES